MTIPQDLVPYKSIISLGLYPSLAILFSLIGVTIMAWFFIYEVTSGPRKRRNIFKELVLALVAAIFLGWAALFLLLWSGVYV